MALKLDEGDLKFSQYRTIIVLSIPSKSLGEGGSYPDASGNSLSAKTNVVSNTIFLRVVLNRGVAQRAQHADPRQHGK